MKTRRIVLGSALGWPEAQGGRVATNREDLAHMTGLPRIDPESRTQALSYGTSGGSRFRAAAAWSLGLAARCRGPLTSRARDIKRAEWSPRLAADQDLATLPLT